MEHIKTLNTKSLQNTVKKGGCGMSDILPVSLQDILHSGKSELRE